MLRPSEHRNGFVALVIVALLTSASGCSHHRVVAHTGDPTQASKNVEKHHQYFWGLVGEPTIYVDACTSHALHDVEVSTTFWQGLATVVTLGIWAPATVEWRCATVPEETFDAPIPGESTPGEGHDAE